MPRLAFHIGVMITAWIPGERLIFPRRSLGKTTVTDFKLFALLTPHGGEWGPPADQAHGGEPAPRYEFNRCDHLAREVLGNYLSRSIS